MGYGGSMETIERRVAREARVMTKQQVMLKAINGEITWIQAADILGVTARHMRRMRNAVKHEGFGELIDGRGTRAARRRRIPMEVVRELCRLKREVYPDFSVRHFYEKATEQHGLRLSYNWSRLVLQEAGIVEKAAGRGKYHRKRERRPMVGMLVHLDASMHEWIAGLPMWDLVVALDDADGRILHARLVEQEGVASSLEALEAVLRRYGRFCELYTDRGSHFCRTAKAGEPPAEEQNGQVARVLHVLGITHIRARSPQARGRSERAFGTIQGRLPQELRLNGISTYEEANRYLEEVFVPDFNRRFTVAPAQRHSAFTPVPKGMDLSLLLSIKHDRIVRNDNTVIFRNLILQLCSTPSRLHFVRCPVTVHQFSDRTLGVSYQGQLLARYDSHGGPLPTQPKRKAA
jgi:hypothetical protein